VKLLHIDSSPVDGASVSRKLTNAIVEAIRKAEPSIEIARRDLAAASPAHLTGELIEVVKLGKAEHLTPRQQQQRQLTDALVEEFQAADAVVIAAPMHNFTVPTQLKA
jgi:FMN-dependent NADH-azoreductase